MEQNFIEMSKVIFTSIDHYRESGRDDKFNIDSIAEYLQRQFLLQQTPCSTQWPQVEQSLLDEAISDVITISNINKYSDAVKLISEQFLVMSKEDFILTTTN